MKKRVAAALGLVWVIAAYSFVANADGHWAEPLISGTSDRRCRHIPFQADGDVAHGRAPARHGDPSLRHGRERRR